jgi:hypothetical protein
VATLAATFRASGTCAALQRDVRGRRCELGDTLAAALTRLADRAKGSYGVLKLSFFYQTTPDRATRKRFRRCS